MNLRKRIIPRVSIPPALASRGRGSLAVAWDYLNQAGLAEKATRLGTHTALVALILFFAWGLREFYVGAQMIAPPGEAPFSGAAMSGALKTPPVNLPDFNPPSQAASSVLSSPPSGADITLPLAGVVRMAQMHTDVPSRSRDQVSQYTVKEGDTLFGIAEQFGLRPETILWANQQVLGDNPHSLRPGQELNILPVDGAYHRWSAGDGLNAVAKFFNVPPEAILTFPANGLDPAAVGDFDNPNIDAGKWLVIPGGRREFVSWSAPVIPLDNPGVAKVLGPGACETVTAGVMGAGLFIWPADNRYISGFDYEPNANHPGLDIDGDEGGAVFAADSGVVVYSGWNNWGYGNVVVINHGNGWQTLYAHLSALYVTCGQSVFQGNTIAAIGDTGNSTGSHLHFEMMYNGAKVNPHDYVK